jgi:hypothetical protein
VSSLVNVVLTLVQLGGQAGGTIWYRRALAHPEHPPLYGTHASAAGVAAHMPDLGQSGGVPSGGS